MSRSVRGPDYGLQVYEKHPAADAYRVGAGFTGYAILAVEKRFSDAELAAEVWHFDHEDFDRTKRMDPDECSDEEWQEYIDRRNEAEAALKRFATLPHFD